jgi:hypothetical protein
MRRAPDERALLALLGVDERASWEDVRRAFREVVRANHPDLHPGDTDAERRLKALNAAWESVNTPGKWAAYARSSVAGRSNGHGGRRGSSAAAGAPTRFRVQRQLRGGAGLVNWQLELDGEVVASIENGGTTLLAAVPGRHRLRVFYGSYSSPPLEVELSRGEELHLGCRQLEGLRVNLFSPRRALVLELLGSRTT